MQESTGFLSLGKPSQEHLKGYSLALCVEDCILKYFCKKPATTMTRYQLNSKNDITFLTTVDFLRRLRPFCCILYHGRNKSHILKSLNIVQLWFAKRIRDIQIPMHLQLTFFQCFIHIVRNNHSP